jgi:cytosine/adenosine deaminase-related metal-dependent hydrolase
MTQPHFTDLKEVLLQKIKERGGWVNAHAHIDRAYTITQENYDLSNMKRHEKWRLNNELKQNSTVTQIYDRMAYAVEEMLEQGVTALATFIDVDFYVQDKSIQAAQKLREKYQNDMIFRFMNQSSYGLFDTKMESKKWFDVAMEYMDIVGGLLKADQGREEEHLDILMSAAKQHDKKIFIHLDELNTPEEKETEMVVRKIKQHQLEGKVVGIHGLSMNCHAKEYRQNLYAQMKEVDMDYVSCPSAWIDSWRSETLTPTHNPVTPVDEMLEHDLKVCLGIDNIADIWKPFTNVDMWLELRILLEANRLRDLDVIADIASTNGRKAIGIA